MLLYVLYYLIIGVVIQLLGYIGRAIKNMSDRDVVKVATLLTKEDDAKFSDTDCYNIVNSAPVIIINVLIWPINIAITGYLICKYLVFKRK